MNEQNFDDHPGVAKIKQMYDRGDFETIDKMVKFWEALENLGAAGSMLRSFLIWCGVIAGSYIALSGMLVDWIKGIK